MGQLPAAEVVAALAVLLAAKPVATRAAAQVALLGAAPAEPLEAERAALPAAVPAESPAGAVALPADGAAAVAKLDASCGCRRPRGTVNPRSSSHFPSPKRRVPCAPLSD